MDDGEAGLVDVAAADGLIREWRGARDGAVEVVGVCGAEGGDGHAGLGEGSGVLGVGVDDGADGRELAVEERVGVEVGGRAECAVNDLAVEVCDHHVLGAEVVVVDARRLDHDEPLLTIDARGVAEGVKDEAALDEFEVGFEDFFAKGLEEHERFHLGEKNGGAKCAGASRIERSCSRGCKGAEARPDCGPEAAFERGSAAACRLWG